MIPSGVQVFFALEAELGFVTVPPRLADKVEQSSPNWGSLKASPVARLRAVRLRATGPLWTEPASACAPARPAELRPSLADLGPRVAALGYVAARQVSLWLHVATLVLAPLKEGVRARKGTVKVALQHAQAVVTARGVHTLDDVAWDEICVLSPLAAFAAKAIETFIDAEGRPSTGRAARAEYEANASASVTALRILDPTTIGEASTLALLIEFRAMRRAKR